MTTIVGIAGSLRKGSLNAMLLRAAKDATPEGATLEIASINGIPLYDGDVEVTGIPDVVRQLKDQIAAAHGLLLVTPEYNNSIPGVFKNAIDWLSRPAADIGRVFRDRPVALMGATTGRGGTLLAQAAWLPVLRTLQTLPWFGGRLGISGAPSVFDDKGAITDDKVRGLLERYMTGFAKFVAGARR